MSKNKILSNLDIYKGLILVLSHQILLQIMVNRVFTYPGIYGPKPEKLLGSVELEIAARVLPQKLFSQNIILALFSGMPFTMYPHLRANLFAVSPPSTPIHYVFDIISLHNL